MSSQFELGEFRYIYGRRHDSWLAARFGLSLAQVRALAAKWCLAKDKRTWPKGPGSMPRWCAEDVAALRYMYPDEPNINIARTLGRTLKAVVSKAHELGLTKSHARLARMGVENVRKRRYG